MTTDEEIIKKWHSDWDVTNNMQDLAAIRLYREAELDVKQELIDKQLPENFQKELAKARASACKCAMCDDDAFYCSDCNHNLIVDAEENARAEGMSDEALYVAYCWLNDGFKVPKEDFTEERKEWVRKAFAEAKATDRRARKKPRGEKE